MSGQEPNAKAIMGAVFIQYFAYGLIYIMEGAKYNEIHGKESTRQAAKKTEESKQAPSVDGQAEPA